jgi:hypothetical protein
MSANAITDEISSGQIGQPADWMMASKTGSLEQFQLGCRMYRVATL